MLKPIVACLVVILGLSCPGFAYPEADPVQAEAQQRLRASVINLREVTQCKLDELPECVKKAYTTGTIRQYFALPGKTVHTGCLRMPGDPPSYQVAFCAHAGNLFLVAYKSYGYAADRQLDVFDVRDGIVCYRASFPLSAQDISTFPKVRAALEGRKNSCCR